MLWAQAISIASVYNIYFYLEKLGFTLINTDYNIFITWQSFDGLVISIFVDNIKIVGLESNKIITQVKIDTTTEFEIVDIRSISFYFGLRVSKNSKKKDNQVLAIYIYLESLNKYYFDKANITSIIIKER